MTTHERRDRADARAAAALALLAAREPGFRRTARRYSLCAADADDAFQRAAEILLTKAPDGATEPHLTAWMHVVTRREALAVRRDRERLLGTPAAADPDARDPLDLLPSSGPDPVERSERSERAAARLALLARLKPNERRAIVLQAQGYSYAEICAICGWTYTKVNRCIAEGRKRLARLRAASAAAD